MKKQLNKMLLHALLTIALHQQWHQRHTHIIKLISMHAIANCIFKVFHLKAVFNISTTSIFVVFIAVCNDLRPTFHVRM